MYSYIHPSLTCFRKALEYFTICGFLKVYYLNQLDIDTYFYGSV